jgi:hypothetical protein
MMKNGPSLRRVGLALGAWGLAVLACVVPAIRQGDDDNADTTETDAESVALLGDVSNPELTLCPGTEPSLITDFEVYQTPELTEPPPRTPIRDPIFGTCLVRATDRRADVSPEDDSRGLKNEYSRVQSFNADGSLLVVRGTEASWYLYDAASLRPLGQLPIEVDPRWDANDPDVIYFSEEARLMAFNVRGGERYVVHDFAADFPDQGIDMVWTRYEGSPSFDGRYWGMMAERRGRIVAFLVYDQETDQVIAARNLSGKPEIDTVTISPLGNYFLAYFDTYCERGALGDDAHPCGLMVYDRNLENGRSLLRIVGHSDVALDAEGREVLIYQDIDTDHISMLDLAIGTVTDLFPIDFSYSGIGLHFSGRASQLPGWALVSIYNGGHPTDYTWMDDTVFAVELKPGGRAVRLAHTHSLVDENQEHDYWAEPQASMNQDFTQVVFTTNWGRSGTDEVEMFMIALPANWPERLP